MLMKAKVVSISIQHALYVSLDTLFSTVHSMQVAGNRF